MFRFRRGVAVVELTGTIGMTLRAPVVLRLLETAENLSALRSVLLDIDSPGGAVPVSEQLYLKVARIAQKKPVVAYVRSLGTSGAYYVSCAATKIVALPTALVGSIGVISVRPVLQGLLQKLGINFSVYKGGKMKDMGGFWRETTPEEQAKFTALVEELYNIFIDVVSRRRKLDEGRVRELATGEVFTGKRAKELGLVDELGDFDRALELTAQLGGVRRRPIWLRPKRGFMERLMGRYSSVPAVSLLSGLEALLSGGLYYLPPSSVPWTMNYKDDSGS